MTKLIKLFLSLTAVGATLACSAQLKAEQYAVMVAIEDYSRIEGASNLPGCAVDLKDLKKLLETSFQFPSSNITSLINASATKANVMKALDQIVAKAKPGDTVVFYYSGHGAQVPDMNDDDEKIDGKDEAFITYDFDKMSPDTWLLDDDLRASLSRLKTKRALVLIDACHSGTGTRSAIINKRAEFGFANMLGSGAVDTESIETYAKSGGGPSNHVLFSGCAANELSAIGVYDGVPRSLFTTALINVMPRMTTAPLTEVNAAIHAEMERLHPVAAARQNPQLETSLTVNLSVLLGPGTPTQEVGQPNNEPPVQNPGSGLPSAFKVAVTTNKRDYSAGEEMVASVISEKGGYLRLYYVNKNGEANLIFPNHYQRDNKITEGQRVDVGDASAPFAFVTEAPGGTELLLAAVSPEQFTDHDALNLSKEKPFEEIGKVKSLRALVDRGVKEISVVERPGDGGPSVPRPVQIGRAGCLYEIHEDSGLKTADMILKQIRVEGRVAFAERYLPFKFDSTELASAMAKQQMAEIAKALNSPELKDSRFKIEGHTCNIGGEAYNLDLSKRRATAIQSKLVSSGVGSSRLVTDGLGELQPKVPNDSEANRAQNRRVEISKL